MEKQTIPKSIAFCKYFVIYGHCFNRHCHFAHSIQELKFTNHSIRCVNIICNDHANGKICRFLPVCKYQHPFKHRLHVFKKITSGKR